MRCSTEAKGPLVRILCTSVRCSIRMVPMLFFPFGIGGKFRLFLIKLGWAFDFFFKEGLPVHSIAVLCFF